MDYFARDCHGLGMKSDFDHLRYIQNCRVMMIVDDAGKKRSSILSSFERLGFSRVNSVRPKTESLGSHLSLFHICIFGTIEDKTK
jgi:hypothetical protein